MRTPVCVGSPRRATPTAGSVDTVGQLRIDCGRFMARLATGAPQRSLTDLLRSVFRFSRFRAHQQQVCEALVEGHNALLVMPTGAGKSLCYQLPGLARGGTTLVVSPLIALMDDQVNKLVELGLHAA